MQIRFRLDFGEADFGDHGVFGEGRAAHVVVNRLTVLEEAHRAVRHQALALGGAHRRAEVGLAGGAHLAFAAFGGVKRDDVVAGLDAAHAFADRDDDARPLVTENTGEDAFRVQPVQGVGVGVADAAGDDAHQHFALLRRHQIQFFDNQRLLRRPGNGGAGLDKVHKNPCWKWWKPLKNREAALYT